MHLTVNWVNTSVIYSGIRFKSFIEKISDGHLYKDVGSKKRFEVTSIEGFNSQHLQKKKSEKDALVFYKDAKTFKNTEVSPVTMVIRGRYSIGDLDGNVHIRMFEPSKKKESNRSVVSCKFSFTNNDKPGALVKTDEQIERYFAYVTGHLNVILGQKPLTKHNIDAISSSEMSLISPKDGYTIPTGKGKGLPYQQVQRLFKRIDAIVSQQGYSYDKEANQKDGKKLSGKFFKPILRNGGKNLSKSRPTINVFNSMRVQANGKYTLEQLKDVYRMFIRAFKEASKDMQLPTALVPPDLRERKIGHCRKNTPEMKGSCTGGRIPKVSNGNVCCYRESIFPGKARKYVQDFVRLGLPIPKVYEKYKDTEWKVEKYTDAYKRNGLRIVTKKGDETFYAPWDCKKQKLEDIRRVARDILKLDTNGKKEDVCKRIAHKLNPPAPKPLPKKRVSKGPGNIWKRREIRGMY